MRAVNRTVLDSSPSDAVLSAGYLRGRAWEVVVASDIFAKLGDIKGESIDDKHKDEIEILSWSWGVENAGPDPAAARPAARKPSFSGLSFMHRLDRASPLLLKACATGQHLKDATITRRKSGKDQQEFLVIKMNDVIITSVQNSDSEGGDAVESVSLAFAKVDVEYRPQKADGSLDAGIHFKYDLKTNKGA
jgi:type VI secretion system secreted protein Hcp